MRDMQKWHLISKPGHRKERHGWKSVLKIHSSGSTLESKQVQLKLNSMHVSTTPLANPFHLAGMSLPVTINIWQSNLFNYYDLNKNGGGGVSVFALEDKVGLIVWEIPTLLLHLHLSLLRKQRAITCQLGTPRAIGRRRVRIITKDMTQRKPGGQRNVRVIFKYSIVHIPYLTVDMQHCGWIRSVRALPALFYCDWSQ